MIGRRENLPVQLCLRNCTFAKNSNNIMYLIFSIAHSFRRGGGWKSHNMILFLFLLWIRCSICYSSILLLFLEEMYCHIHPSFVTSI